MTKPKKTRQPRRTTHNSKPISAKGREQTERREVGQTRAEVSPPVKPQTKAARVLDLLRRPDGATLDDLVAETGWLPYTTRAALTGLKKKGHAVTSAKTDGVRRYRVAAGASG